MLKRNGQEPSTEYEEYDPIKSKKRYKTDKWFELLYRTGGAIIVLAIGMLVALYYWLFG
ncbi:hypothetical protein ACSVDE_09650 [Pseudalkalibacillus sp. Hm43]|uniref:hypothetical protein n=1 Tax=Pseudalkalibacillus sp. Hm43 TaxID=3450742 RepID=UPI003F4210C7